MRRLFFSAGTLMSAVPALMFAAFASTSAIAQPKSAEFRTLDELPLVMSDAREDRVSSKSADLVIANIRLEAPAGYLGPDFEVEAYYQCDNGSISVGELQNPSAISAILREQTRRAETVCQAIHRECKESGERFGAKEIAEWLARPERTCAEVSRVSVAVDAVDAHPFGHSANSRCLLSNLDQEAFNQSRITAQRERILLFQAQKACPAAGHSYVYQAMPAKVAAPVYY